MRLDNSPEDYDPTMPSQASQASAKESLEPGYVELQGWVVTTPNLQTSQGMASYIQDPNRLVGIKVIGSFGLTKGDVIDISGDLTIVSSERCLKPTKLLHHRTRAAMPKTIGITTNRMFDLACLGSGAIVTGIRARVWGKVISLERDYSGNFVRIDDGSNIIDCGGWPLMNEDGTPILDDNGQIIIVGRTYGLRVHLEPGQPLPPIDSYCAFTGVSSCDGNKATLWDAEVSP
jgi:hypothetical protein